MIKPIETIYAGSRFRSRLEARWAVFFNNVGIRYVYEPEGFEYQIDPKDPVIRYLPDFHLPELETYVEVKPNFEKLMEERDKIGVFIDFNGPLAKGLLVLGQIPYYQPQYYGSRIPAFIQYYWDSGVRARLVGFDIHENLSFAPAFRSKQEVIDLLEIRDLGVCETNTLPNVMDSGLTDSARKSFITSLSFNDYVPTRKVDNHYYALLDDDMDRISEHFWPGFKAARYARFEYGEEG